MINRTNKINMIVSFSKYGIIGFQNNIPWYVPEDLKFFKQKTEFHCVLMGRKTWESLPSKPLSNRIHYVVSSQTFSDSQLNKNVYCFTNIDEAIYHWKQNFSSEKDLWVCGGQSIYDLFLEKRFYILNKVYTSIIHEDVYGDKYFNIISLVKNFKIDQSYWIKDSKVEVLEWVKKESFNY
ncbi:MAG: dihydrofolate reductase [Candidatus Dojkabacteria bacterium]|nr:dihydrofolate reductase [Candidatus Dojkabacteria bacterium]